MVSKESEALDAYSKAVIEASERVGPAVVRIDVTHAPADASQRGRGPRGGIGSGVIYASDGHIVTNEHVIRGARQIDATLADGRSFPGGVLFADPAIDLAIVRIGVNRLPVAELHRATPRVGQLVIAIGAAFGLGGTVTAGVVSAVNRKLQEGPVNLRGLVQTDTPINPGNSGGPLIDAQGRVIGINVAILPYARGIGFAIPTETVMALLARFGAARQRPARLMFGISGVATQIDAAVVNERRLSSDKGVMVLEVHPGSPAEAASFHIGDTILSIQGRPVREAADQRRAIESMTPGHAVDVEFLRDNRKRKVIVIIGVRSDALAMA